MTESVARRIRRTTPSSLLVFLPVLRQRRGVLGRPSPVLSGSDLKPETQEGWRPPISLELLGAHRRRENHTRQRSPALPTPRNPGQ